MLLCLLAVGIRVENLDRIGSEIAGLGIDVDGKMVAPVEGAEEDALLIATATGQQEQIFAIRYQRLELDGGARRRTLGTADLLLDLLRGQNEKLLGCKT